MNILLLLIAIAILVWATILLVKNIKLSKNGITMEADIVDVLKKRETSTDSEGYSSTTNMYYPVFSYTYKDQEYRKESNSGVSNKRKYQVGNKMNIVFMAETPEKVKIKNMFNMWLLPIILFLVGIVMLIGSFVA